jgi:hypothetical protein
MIEVRPIGPNACQNDRPDFPLSKSVKNETAAVTAEQAKPMMQTKSNRPPISFIPAF